MDAKGSEEKPAVTARPRSCPQGRPPPTSSPTGLGLPQTLVLLTPPCGAAVKGRGTRTRGHPTCPPDHPGQLGHSLHSEPGSPDVGGRSRECPFTGSWGHLMWGVLHKGARPFSLGDADSSCPEHTGRTTLDPVSSGDWPSSEQGSQPGGLSFPRPSRVHEPHPSSLTLPTVSKQHRPEH